MTEFQMHELARWAIERHLGDVVESGGSVDELYDNAFCLAHDALLDAGIDARTATKIAQYQAQLIAQP